MEYRRLGKSGLQISGLSLGSWLTFGQQISDKVAAELMSIAYDAGVNFFDNALKWLQVDYLDFYFCHRPDQNTPIEETVWAMNTLLQQGKILYWGTSEWSAANPNVSTVILGASKPEQLKENLTALEVVPLLTDKIVEEIEGIVQNKPHIPQF